jgi:PIN domain nuclease of toxin-antitoxin system
VAHPEEALTYLDTHVVVWLFAGEAKRFSRTAARIIDRDELRISPAVALELEFLHESGRIRYRAHDVLAELRRSLGLELCDRPFADVGLRACDLVWTRDVFDRLIVAQAMVGGNILVTKDTSLLAHYPRARW